MPELMVHQTKNGQYRGHSGTYGLRYVSSPTILLGRTRLNVLRSSRLDPVCPVSMTASKRDVAS